MYRPTTSNSSHPSNEPIVTSNRLLPHGFFMEDDRLSSIMQYVLCFVFDGDVVGGKFNGLVGQFTGERWIEVFDI